MAQEAGFTPQAVPSKILFPLLEGASFEDNEDLHDMWAALLANASMENAIVVRLRYIALLREMAPDEAELLNTVVSVQERVSIILTTLDEKRVDLDQAREGLQEVRNKVKANFKQVSGESEVDREFRFATCLAALQTAGLTYDSVMLASFSDCHLTPTGYEFLRACRPPKPKS